MPTISRIYWISEEIREAEIEITDGKITLICFAHPLEASVNDAFEEPLHGFMCENVLLINESVFLAERFEESFRYYMNGQVADTGMPLVRLHDILIELDIELPSHIKIGDFVSFACERIDFWG